MTAAVTRLREKLEELLGERPEAALERERTAFDRASYPCQRRIVIYGAGGLGQSVLHGLRANGVEPLAFADRNPAMHGTRVGELEVHPPEEAIRRFGSDSVFVVAVWNPAASGGLREIAAFLSATGCRRVAPFTWLFWKYPQTFLPYYLWDLPSRLHAQSSAVRQAFTLIAGARSQAEFLHHLELRLTGDFRCVRPPDGDTQYFPSRLFRPREDECFVDCGAFDGDSLRALAGWTGGRFRKAVAFEADPLNFAALERTVSTEPKLKGRVRAVRAAVGRNRSMVRFAASGRGNAGISDSGDIVVDCVPLDDALLDEQPTYIKMDIEGAELDALHGGSATLCRRRPLLAVCTYHAQDHLWQVPLGVRELMPESRLVLRSYCVDGFDLVCYAIPSDRAADFSEENVEGHRADVSAKARPMEVRRTTCRL